MTPQILAAATMLVVAPVLFFEYRRAPLGPRPLGVWVAKPVASALFIATALSSGALDSAYGRAVLVALVLSWLGDVLLIPRHPAAFLTGLVSFLLGHVGYVLAFYMRGVDMSVVPAALVGVFLVGAPVALWLLPKVKSRMRAPVAAYMIVISLMVVAAIATESAHKLGTLAIGAGLFYVSDICVARERFVTSGFRNRLIGLPMYYAAQVLFALSVASPPGTETLDIVELDFASGPLYERRAFPRFSVEPSYDSDGVPLYNNRAVTGLYHPVLLAHEGLMLLRHHLEDENPEHLRRAELYSEKIHAKRVMHDGVPFFPYPFDFDLHAIKGETLHGPWFSAMAQGLVMALDARLARVTGNKVHIERAREVFESFRVLKSETKGPWVTRRDDLGDLWLEEYPTQPPTRVLNGFVYAVYGLYEYYLLTHDPEALAVLSDAVSTLKRNLLKFRNEGDISAYCLKHRVKSSSYHVIHVLQIRMLHAITRDPFFAEAAAIFRKDHWPEPEANEDGVPRVQLACLTPDVIEAIRSRPAALGDRFTSCESELRARLTPVLGVLERSDLQVVFASIVANHMAPYGGSKVLELDALLRESQLDCDNYAALAAHLADLGGPAGLGSADAGRLSLIGFDGGAVGNHAQMFYERGPRRLLLDPTLGLVAAADLEQVKTGRPIRKMVIFDRWRSAKLAPFEKRVVEALASGRYRPEDLLYAYDDLARFVTRTSTPAR